MTKPNSLMTAFAVLILAGLAAPALAQQPSQAQQDALKANCRSDFMSKCRGVTPGGADALACLKKNVASLSAGCQGAVNALNPPAAAASPPPAPRPAAAAPPPPAPAAAAPPPAAPAPVAAAPAAAPTVTAAPPPAAPLTAAVPAVRPAPPKPAPKPAAVAAAPAAASAAPTAAQQDAIKQSCRSDFMANCAGVQPGGSAALACLQKNTPKLSASCQQAVKSIGGAAATAAAAPTAASTAASADAPVMPTAAQQSAIQRTCRGDFMRNCRSVQPGGPEALACLQNNSAKLSPDCKTSITAVAMMPGSGPSPGAIAAGATTTPAAAAATRAARPSPPGILPAGRILRKLKERANQQ